MPLAKRFFRYTTRLSLITLSILCLSFALARKELASLFVSDAEVAAITANVILLGAFNKFGDGLQFYLQGPIRALSLQKVASYWAIGTYYLVGIPLASIFAFACDFGALSFQAAFVPVIIIMCVAFTCILRRQDWQVIADQVVERIDKEAYEISNRQ